MKKVDFVKTELSGFIDKILGPDVKCDKCGWSVEFRYGKTAMCALGEMSPERIKKCGGKSKCSRFMAKPITKQYFENFLRG